MIFYTYTSKQVTINRSLLIFLICNTCSLRNIKHRKR